uniref:Transposase n=1 Tax=Panagrellus redivivus TaxID=6233 RepID=A0A7E4ZWS0_PANRE
MVVEIIAIAIAQNTHRFGDARNFAGHCKMDGFTHLTRSKFKPPDLHCGGFSYWVQTSEDNVCLLTRLRNGALNAQKQINTN